MQFQLDKNVPNVYVEESRDFQLLCHIIDVYLNQAIEKTFDMRFSLDPKQCRAELLPLLARRMGFITSLHIPDDVLRAICSVFPTCIKMKGTLYAIRLAAHAILGVDEKITLLSVLKDDNEKEKIVIVTNVTSANLPYLKEVLRFITPPGVIYSYSFNVKEVKVQLKLESNHKIGRIRTNTASNAHIISTNQELPAASGWSNTPLEADAYQLYEVKDIEGSYVPLNTADSKSLEVITSAAGIMYPQVGFIRIAGVKDTKKTAIAKLEEKPNE